jgi:hypothetical protein
MPENEDNQQETPKEQPSVEERLAELEADMAYLFAATGHLARPKEVSPDAVSQQS